VNSKEIQEAVYMWALERNFSAPYVVLKGGPYESSKGTRFYAVTFGQARTLDATVEIYNRNFIVLRTSAWGSEVFKNYESLMEKLNQF